MAIHSVPSPLPGTFYRRSAPDQPLYKKEGDAVQPDDVIGLIEVMKQFTEVTADVTGTLIKFHVDNDSPIDPGMPLADIDVA